MGERSRQVLTVLAAVAVTAALCGCGHARDDAETSIPVVALQSLPSFEDTQERLQTAMNSVKAAADQMIPSIRWGVREGSGLGCDGPYAGSGGRGFLMPDSVAEKVAVSEHQWAAIEAAAEQAAATLDATDTQIMQNGRGNHDVGFYGPAGVFLKVGYRGNLVVSGYTGCRLPRDAG